MYIQKCKVQLDKSIIHNFLINFFGQTSMIALLDPIFMMKE